MTICDLETKNKVMAEIEKAERLIGDIADDYGLSHRLVYNWVRVTRNSRKKAVAAKAAKVNRKSHDQTDSVRAPI